MKRRKGKECGKSEEEGRGIFIPSQKCDTMKMTGKFLLPCILLFLERKSGVM